MNNTKGNEVSSNPLRYYFNEKALAELEKNPKQFAEICLFIRAPAEETGEWCQNDDLVITMCKSFSCVTDNFIRANLNCIQKLSNLAYVALNSNKKDEAMKTFVRVASIGIKQALGEQYFEMESISEGLNIGSLKSVSELYGEQEGVWQGESGASSNM
jgi:hypothetical protein